jgi:peptide/nickel transport system permease protein
MARLIRHPQGALGLALLAVFVGLALAAPALSPQSPLAQDLGSMLQSPSQAHPVGTDELGRDVLSRLLYGARVSLVVGALSVLLGMSLGVPLGLAAGYRGGLLDQGAMRLVDALLSFPALLLALAINAALGADLRNVIIAIGVVQAPRFARLVRGQALVVRELEFVQAARALGANGWRICRAHLAPNLRAPVIVEATVSVAAAILTEASLSFLGLGIPPPDPSWGSMLKNGYSYVSGAPWLAIFPGLAISLNVIAANFFGDGLRDVLDPRAQARWREEAGGRAGP